MAVDDQDAIDIVVIHTVLLQEKINVCLAFVESGEMVDAYPNSEGRPVAIRIVFKYAPTADGVLFLERVGEARFRNHFEFRWSELTGVPGFANSHLRNVPPSIANAIFAATGKRVRDLPMRKTKLV